MCKEREVKAAAKKKDIEPYRLDYDYWKSNAFSARNYGILDSGVLAAACYAPTRELTGLKDKFTLSTGVRATGKNEFKYDTQSILNYFDAKLAQVKEKDRPLEYKGSNLSDLREAIVLFSKTYTTSIRESLTG